MTYLLDTHLLLWSAIAPSRLSAEARALISDPANELSYSAASIWEVAIKATLGREGFDVDPAALRDGLRANGYGELAIDGRHAAAVTLLPPLHRDPFDRLLVAQARVESMILLTSDETIASYGAPARLL